MNPPVVSFDVDNTLAKRGSQMCELINDLYPDAELTTDDFTEWNFEVEGAGRGIEELINEVLVEEPSCIRGMEPQERAVALTQELGDAGVTVQIVTHRPPETHERTKEWLETHGVQYSEFVEDVPRDKSRVSGDILIDDHHRNVADMVDAGKTGVLVLQLYNQHEIPDRSGFRVPSEKMQKDVDELVQSDEQWAGIREIVLEEAGVWTPELSARAV
jgi:5'(3')-deoxyribonucleotidase